MRKLPPLNALRAFDAVSRRGGIAPAAAELRVTPSTVSQHIAKLEGWMGAPLLHRETNRTDLTEAGARFAAAIRLVFDRLEAEIAQAQNRRHGCEVVVSVLPSFAAQWLVKRLDSFAELHCDIRVRVVSTPDLADFAADGADLAIRFGPGDYPGMISVLLLEERVAPVCSPQLLARHGPVRDLDDVLRLPLIGPGDRGFGGTNLSWNDWLARSDRGAEGHGAVQQCFTDTHLEILAALSGRGCMLGRSALIGDEILAGRLVAPLYLWERSDWAYHIVYPKHVTPRAEVRKFITWLRAAASATEQIRSWLPAPAAFAAQGSRD